LRDPDRVSDTAIVTGSFTLGAVVLTAGVDWLRRRHDEGRRDREARQRAITETVAATVQLRDAVLLFRRMMIARTLALGGVATGVDYAGSLISAADETPPWWAYLAAAVRDLLKAGGLLDQSQIAAGERYRQIVTPPLQRLTAAGMSVQFGGTGGQLQDAAARLLEAAGRLADAAQSRKRDYGRAERAFSEALQALRDASVRSR
jgi:hypothetical protein